MGKKQQSGKAYGMPAGIGLGVLLAMAVTLAGAVALTGMVAGERLELGALGYGIMVIQFLAGLVGAVAAMLVVKHRKMQVCLATGAGYYLVLLAGNAMFFGGQYEGALATALIVLAASGITAIVGSREGSGRKTRRRKPAYR